MATSARLRWHVTPPAEFERGWGDAQQAVISAAELREAEAGLRAWPGYRPTPLIDLPHAARTLGLGSLSIKDEGQRFAVGSFKALGPPYALLRLAQSRAAEHSGTSALPIEDLFDGRQRTNLADLCVCAATSGNHGRALAWAARELGCRCVISMPEHTSRRREQAIAAFGAEVRRVPGNFDASAARARLDATREGWIIIGELPEHPCPAVPRHILHGYAVLGLELLAAWAPGPPATHLFVSAGSGKLAAGIVAALWLEYGDRRPHVVVVEPHAADCVFRSARAGERTPTPGDLATLMDGLSVGQVSPLAWPLLFPGAAAFLTIGDDLAVEALRSLARPQGGDQVVELGETGVAAFAGLWAVAADPQARADLHLDDTSRVVVIGCEGVTDPAIYQALLDD